MALTFYFVASKERSNLGQSTRPRRGNVAITRLLETPKSGIKRRGEEKRNDFYGKFRRFGRDGCARSSRRGNHV
jgi:hypothetical protein